MKLNKKQLIIAIIVIILTNIMLNYNYFISKTNGKEKVYDYEEQYSNTYEINNITNKTNMIYIKFEYIPQAVTIEYKNADLENYTHFNKPYHREEINSDELYVYKALENNITDLKFTVKDGQIKKIILNPKVKYNLNIFNTCIISIVIFLLISLTRYNKAIDFNDKLQRKITIIIIFILSIILTSFMLKHYNHENNMLYYKYTDAIIQKKLYLDYPIDNKLIKSTNPYDTSKRDYQYFWDASYYNGKYYCYFGILPIITILAPIKILTGRYISISYLSLAYSVLGIIFSYLLYKEIIKKYYPKIEYKMFIISFLYILLGSKLFWCMHRSDFYELVSIAAYTHIVLGLYLVLFNNNNSIKRDLLGYMILALAILCRPTSLLLSLLIIPKLIDKIKKHELKFKNILSLVIPYIIIGIITMTLNYIRFGNILEFGTTYQLTTSNYINNHFFLIRAFIGFIHYFFAPFQIKMFPFSIIGIMDNYPIISDFALGNTGGGIIFTSVIGIIIFFYPWIIKYVKKKELKTYLFITLLIAIALLSISAGSIGMTGRYMFDFNYLFYFVITIFILVLTKEDKSIILKKIFYFGMILSIIINYCISLTNVI